MSNTITSIASAALTHLGMRPLTDYTTSLANNDPSAIAINTYWEQARDDVYREHRWTFNTTQETLGLIGEELILGWLYLYTYPASAAMVWYVYNESTVTTKDAQEFEVVYVPTLNVTAVCSDNEEAYCDYGYKITDVTLWEPKFVQAFSYKLAAQMAHTLIGDPSIGVKMMEIYGAVISEAKRVGAQEKKKKREQTSGYVDAR